MYDYMSRAIEPEFGWCEMIYVVNMFVYAKALSFEGIIRLAREAHRKRRSSHHDSPDPI